MSAKEVKFSDDARSKMFTGVNVLANAVKSYTWAERKKCRS